MSSTVVDITCPVMPLSPSPRCIIIPALSGLKRFTRPQLIIKKSGFRILSYNLLADIYVKTGRDQYNHCPADKLTWEYRRQNLLREIISYEADIVCLQEVQSDHFKNFFEPQLARFGYSSIYQGKLKELYDGKEYVTDGCATFFRFENFKLVKKYEVEYGKMALPIIYRLDIQERDQAMKRLAKENIATVLILEEINNGGSRICVANTHLQGGMGLSDVRLFQVISLVRGLEKIDSLGIPVLLCGDMNSAPGSDTYKFLQEGKVNYFKQEKKDILGISKYLKLSNSMNLANAYSEALDEHEDETLDYIFYSENKMKLDWVLEFPSYQSVGKKRQLPTPQWSSDHIALVADLRIERADREENYSDDHLPVDPWQELKHVKILEVKKKPTFKRLKKKSLEQRSRINQQLISING